MISPTESRFHASSFSKIQYSLVTFRVSFRQFQISIDHLVLQVSFATLRRIFINALLQMLTATQQNQGISYGLQIGNNQEDSNQDADYGYQYHEIGFFDDISIFAETPEGMQICQTWCRRSHHGMARGIEINVKKFLLVIDKDQKRRESMPAPDLRINNERLKTVRH